MLVKKAPRNTLNMKISIVNKFMADVGERKIMGAQNVYAVPLAGHYGTIFNKFSTSTIWSYGADIKRTGQLAYMALFKLTHFPLGAVV